MLRSGCLTQRMPDQANNGRAHDVDQVRWPSAVPERNLKDSNEFSLRPNSIGQRTPVELMRADPPMRRDRSVPDHARCMAVRKQLPSLREPDTFESSHGHSHTKVWPPLSAMNRSARYDSGPSFVP